MKKLIIIGVIVIVLIVAAILVKRMMDKKKIEKGLNGDVDDENKAPVGMVDSDGNLTPSGKEILIATLQAANLSPAEIQQIVLAANEGNETVSESEVVEEEEAV